jgi:hypothetical protein
MAKSKYMPKYKKMVKDYFFKFIDLRDDPDKDDKTERQGMIPIDMTGDKPIVSVKPCSGYPTLTKFACKIGVTTRTLRNWRAEFSDFDEICELCEDMFDDIMDERALVGSVDGRVAMKIRELKANARDNAARSGVNGGGLKIEITRHIPDGGGIELKEWEGEVNEDTGYTSAN